MFYVIKFSLFDWQSTLQYGYNIKKVCLTNFVIFV